jgi:hypothetical protein
MSEWRILAQILSGVQRPVRVVEQLAPDGDQICAAVLKHAFRLVCMSAL